MYDFISNPEIQQQIDLVSAFLRSMQVGQTATWNELGANYYVVKRARETVEKADGIRFATVHSVGIKRLAANEVPALGVAGIRHIHRAGKRTIAKLTNLRGYNDMTADDRLRVAAQRMIATAVVEKTTRASVKEAENNVRTAGAAIDFGSVLRP